MKKIVFATISEISKWDITILEDDIQIGTILHQEGFDGGEPFKIMDGEYEWDGHKIQVDSEGMVVMIDGKSADIELKKTKMEKSTKDKIIDSVKDFFAKNKINVKITEPVDYTERLEKLVTFSKDKESGTLEKFEDVTLADGTIAIVEPALEAGAAIVIMDSEDTPVGAPVGEYELEDGRVIVVEKEGVILEIKEAISDGDGDGGTDDEETLEVEEIQKVKKIIERVETEKVFENIKSFSAIAEELKTANKTNLFLVEDNELMTEKYKDVVNKFDALQTFVQDVLGKLLDEPAQEPIVMNRNPLKKEEKKNIFHQPYSK